MPRLLGRFAVRRGPLPAHEPVQHSADGSIDAAASPLVNVWLPAVRRRLLWTVGEAHFLSTPLRKLYPGLHKVSSAFSKWLGGLPCIYPSTEDENNFNYYLEGSVRNFDAPVYAFESGMSALTRGQYFVAPDDTEYLLDKLCMTLRLRGIEC